MIYSNNDLIVSELGDRVVHYKSEVVSAIENDDLSDEDESESVNNNNTSKTTNLQTKFIQQDMIMMPLKPSDNKKVLCEITVIN